MVVPAGDVAAALRDRLPGVPIKKLHKLLYYCQGHHLAATDQALFSDSVSAWDMGPVVGHLWHHERSAVPSGSAAELTEAQLNTIGYVVSRYGGLTGRDLEHLTHAEGPWQRADRHRPPGGTARIEHEWMRDYFAVDASDQEDVEVVLDSAQVANWLTDASRRRVERVRPDSYVELHDRTHAS